MELPESPITVFESKVLLQYQTFHEKPPSVGSIFLSRSRYYAVTFIFFAAVVTLCFAIELNQCGYYTLGVIVGALARDIRQFRITAKAWPVFDRVINWERLTSLLSECKAK